MIFAKGGLDIGSTKGGAGMWHVNVISKNSYCEAVHVSLSWSPGAKGALTHKKPVPIRVCDTWDKGGCRMRLTRGI